MILIVLSVYPVFVESKDLLYKCEKNMLSNPLKDVTAFFFTFFRLYYV
jgi:hypothetical protein